MEIGEREQLGSKLDSWSMVVFIAEYATFDSTFHEDLAPVRPSESDSQNKCGNSTCGCWHLSGYDYWYL